MGALFFCNVGWMARYEGLVRVPDKIVGGGKWVSENKTGGEVCNFVSCANGYVYGHVETIQGERDRQIRIEAVGGKGQSVDGVDVVWTATDPDAGGRKIVGWYRNATVFRKRQQLENPPSRQHDRDELTSYRIRALGTDACRLDLQARTVTMPRGPGFMGHTPWWTPLEGSAPAVRAFAGEVRALLDGQTGGPGMPAKRRSPGRNSPGAARDPYVRYVEAYELQISPRHSDLQKRFQTFLAKNGATALKTDFGSVDLRYHDHARGTVLTEVKPCETASARYAIRTAMGQLLDYRQRQKEAAALMIVLEVQPNDEDTLLATANGFGIGYPAGKRFVLVWPDGPKVG